MYGVYTSYCMHHVTHSLLVVISHMFACFWAYPWILYVKGLLRGFSSFKMIDWKRLKEICKFIQSKIRRSDMSTDHKSPKRRPCFDFIFQFLWTDRVIHEYTAKISWHLNKIMTLLGRIWSQFNWNN